MVRFRSLFLCVRLRTPNCEAEVSLRYVFPHPGVTRARVTKLGSALDSPPGHISVDHDRHPGHGRGAAPRACDVRTIREQL